MKYLLPIILVFPLVSRADMGDGCLGFQGGYGMMNSGLGGFGFLGIVLNLILWVAIILGIVYFARMLASGRSGEKKDALEILKQRYAKGELKKDEFEQMKKDLE